MSDGEINKIFTINYSQPSEYKFSLDSILTPQKISDYLKKLNYKSPLSLLDLCAGSGVMGLELQFHFPYFSCVDFVEIQSAYLQHFEYNLAEFKNKYPDKFSKNLTTHFYCEDFQNFEREIQNKYNIILCNPPYFRLGQGKNADSKLKQRSRFMSQDEFKNLYYSLENLLEANGHAFVLLRDLSNHGIDLIQELKNLKLKKSQFEILDQVRGTFLVHLKLNT
jgi:tRNA1Val (adenine37-N6)-methyltransferase